MPGAKAAGKWVGLGGVAFFLTSPVNLAKPETVLSSVEQKIIVHLYPCIKSEKYISTQMQNSR